MLGEARNAEQGPEQTRTFRDLASVASAVETPGALAAWARRAAGQLAAAFTHGMPGAGYAT
jgi:hypothetical protein